MPAVSPKLLLRVAIVLVSIFVPLTGGAEAQAPARPTLKEWVSSSDLRKLCAAGRRTQIFLGKAILHVDLWALAGLQLQNDEQLENSNCPSQIRGRQLFFYLPNDPETFRFFVERGLPFHISIYDASKVSLPPAEVMESPANRRHLADGAMIDEITDLHAQRYPLVEAERIYRLQHRRADDGLAQAAIRIGCTGRPDGPTRRTCSTRYRYGSDLVVAYQFSAHGRWISGRRLDWPTRDGAVSEPDGFLVLDENVRNWLNGLKRP